jgi:hypothetical protein
MNKAVAQKEKEKDELREFLKKRRVDEIERTEFEKDTLELGNLEKVKQHMKEFTIKSKFDDKALEKLETEKTIEQIKFKYTLGFDNRELKRELVQSSFWMADSKDTRELGPEDVKSLAIQQVKSVMLCPADNLHPIKIKDLFPLHFEGNNFTCFASKKKLGFQKIVALRTCGHLYIEEYFKSYVGASSVCLCGKKFFEGDVIKMESAKSSFAEHNPVVATVYQPSFAG